MAQMTLPEGDEVIQALVPDRLHEPLGVRIAVGTLSRRLHAGNAARSQDRNECLSEQRIPIVDEVLRAAEKPIDGIGEVSRNLLHPLPARINLNPGDFNSAALYLHDEGDHEETM